MKILTPKRALTITAIVIAFLTMAPGANASVFSFPDLVSEFFSWQSPQKNNAPAGDRISRQLNGERLNILEFSLFEPVPSYTTVGAAVLQDFNALGSSGTATLPADWRFGSSSAYSSGVTAATLTAGTSGTGILNGTSGGGYYNFANGVTASSTDRAVGWLTSTGFTSPRQLFVKLTNNTGTTIGSANIAYDIEKYRSGTRSFTVNFFTSTDGTNWTAQPSGDQAYSGNANNTTVFNPPTTISKSVTVNDLSIANGGDLYLRWSYTGTFSGGSSSTNAQGLGIDNFSFTPFAATPGTVQFDSTSYTDLEGATKTITVNRVGGSLGAVSVNYATGGGTAAGAATCTAGVDYISASGTLNWADGDAAAKTFNVQLCNDVVADTENFQLTLSSPVGTSISGTNPVTLAIIDNPPGTLQFFSSSSNADENLPSAAVLVSRAGGSSGTVSADYAVTGGTAAGGAACTAGVDYITPAPGTLTWTNGDAADKFIDVPLCTDLITYEGPETIELTLSNAQGGAALGSPAVTTLTINDVGARFFNNTQIAINGGPAAPYPSDINVAGLPGAITDVKVTLIGVTHTFPDDIDVLLVSPAGRNFLMMSDIGGDPNITNRTYTFSDAAVNFMQDASSNPAGTYKPTNYDVSQQDDAFDAPAPSMPYFTPGPDGSDTFAGAFGDTDANGTWSLYVRDAFPGADNGSINAGWSLEIKTAAPGPGTVEFSAPVYSDNEGATATVNVKRVTGGLGSVSVDYATGGGTANGGAACGAGVDYVNTSGTLTWGDADVSQKSFTVQLCSDALTAESNETIDLTLSNPAGTTISGTNPAALNIVNNDFDGSTFSNHNGIAIPDSGAGSPYPSTITVSGMTGNISDMRVKLNNLSHSFAADITMLLVGPQGQSFLLFSNVGGGQAVSDASVTLRDLAPNLVPEPIVNGTYKPTNIDGGDFFDSPAPTPPYASPAPVGTDTFLSAFGGTNPNGVWSLYVYDRAGGDFGQVAGGWDLDIQTAAPTPGTVEFSAAGFNGAEGDTATVTANRVGGILGAVSVDYATSSGTAIGGGACGAGVDYVNTAGILSWADGDSTPQTFTVSLCPDAEAGETTETVNLTLSNAVGTAISGTNPATLNIENNSFTGSTFSNSDPIVIPNVGSAAPYPSTITVSGMTGAITEVRMTLKNFSHTYTSDVDILLVSPAGQKFVVMSDAGSNTPSNDVTLTLRDSAAANMTGAPLATGSYKPTDIPGNPDNWASPAPAGPYNSPAPWGGSTFASVFNGADPNGVWSLYVRDQFSPDGGAIAGGWNLQIAAAETVRFNPGDYITTENAGTVSLQVVRPSSGYAATVDYTLGSAGALYPAVGGASCDSGIDYINTPGTLNFAIGELAKNIDVTLCDDGVFDGLKIILPELSNPTGGMILGSPGTAAVFINDDEAAPTLSVGDVTVNESAGTATFVVTQSFATGSLTQFLYSTSDGSALAGFDYTGAANASGTIPAGQTSANIVVPIMNDNGFEETETFSVGLTGIVNAAPADPSAVGTITDDDTAASYVVTSTNNSNDGSCNAAHCSLREAMNASNAAPGIISFAPGLSGTITLTGSRPQITNNVVINGPGADVLAVSGNNAVTIFDIPNAGTAVTIRGLTIRNGFNLDFGQGGAITNGGLLTVENSVITASRGNFAGAIQTYSPLTIRNSTLSNNIGGNDGMQPGCSSIGGAIDSSNEVTINITNSTITGNSVSTNCSANSGAINLFAGRVVITNSTITNNTSSDISAAIGGGSPTISVIRNSIIAGNTGAAAGADVEGAFASEGFNIIGDAGAVTAFDKPTDQVGSSVSPVDPMLGALGSNGGTTPTHLPLAGSPALDKGFSFGSTTDQRGQARPADGAIPNAAGGDGSDIGAVEVAVPMTIQFSSAAYSDSETNSGHVFNVMVSRFGGSVGAVSVDYAVTDGSAAVADSDYSISPAAGTLSWADGDAADKNIAITVTGDTKFETDETVGVALSNVTGGALPGIPMSAVLTITNDDAEPTISVDDTVFGGDTLVPNAFTVSLSNPSSQTVTVHYQTADDTALGGEDYTSASGTLTFDPGETTKTVPVSVLPNTSNEAAEQFFLNLDTPTNATIADGQGIGTIFDDDPQAAVTIGDVAHNEGSSGTTSYTFTVTKTGDTAQTISVDYSTFNNTAGSPSDFPAVSGTLSFGPAEFTKTITVDVNGDMNFEADEIFYVRLFNPVAADIIDGEGTGTITNDDAPTIYIVNVNADTDDGTCDAANCTLREAINWANSTGGQIDFAPNVTGSISLLSNLPALVNGNAIVINGPGAGVLAVKRDSSAGAMRIFDINGGGNYTINGLAVNDGDVRPIGGAFNNLGGAIRILSSRGVTINNCTFTNNWGDNAGAIYNGTNTGTGPLTVNNSTFTANNANQSGGAIYNRFNNIVTVNHSTFDVNGGPFFGGAIYNRQASVMFISDSLFTGNVANSGGAVYNDDNGSITISRSNFIGNHAQVAGAIGNKDGGLDVFNSTLSGNTSNGDGGAASNRLGTIRFFSSTLSGNTSGNAGGAVYFTFEGASNGTFNNCTITGNHAGTGGGIMVFNGQSIVRFGNTIMAGNTALTQAPDLYGQIYSSGYNIFGKRNGNGTSIFNEQPSDIIGSESSPANPLLGPLADNGGPTKTRAPLPGSPAINAGNAFGETADQRGFARTVGSAADIGAFEIQNAPASIAAFSGTPQSAFVGSGYAPLQARVLDSNNDPVGGVPVTFTAPSSGASGTFPGGVFSATAMTAANGVATAPVLTANNTSGSFQVSAGYAASPSATFSLANIARPGISVDDVTFTGADSLVPAGFTVSLSEPSPNTITVHYQSADGTAIAGEDYTAVSGTLTFDPGETSKPVPVDILPNTAHENTEQFFLNLDSPNSNAVIGDGQGVGTIPNDDAAPTLAIDDVTHNEGYTGTTAFTFTVTKTGDTALSATVDYAVLDGSATLAGNDYQAASGQLSFLASETSKTITVNVNGDFTNEPDENFTVHLSNAVAATISDADGAGTIINDDAPPAITYVDDDWTSSAPGTDPDGTGPAIAIGYDSFDTIQEGIDGVTATGTVNVYPGTYKENPNVNKAATLKGANAGTPGGAVRGPESVVVSNGNQNQVFFLNTSDTAIDGFTIDGDDPAVTGAPLASGNDTNAQYGFRPANGSFNLTIKNNIVKRAFVGFRGDNGSGGNSIDGNWFDSIGNFDFGYAVSLRNNYYANVTNNKMTRVWVGVHANNFSSAGPANWNVTGNEIHSYAAGLFHNLQYGSATGMNFSSNQLSAETGSVANNFGILIAGVQNSVAMTMSGNSISGTDYGIGLTNTSTGNVITVDSSNSVTGVAKAGVYLTDNLTFNPVSTADLTSNAFADPIAVKLNGLSITTAAGAPGAAAVKIENSRASAADVTSTAEITGVTINGGSGSKGVEVVGPMTNVTMKSSVITNVGTGIALQNSSAAPMTVNAHFNRIIAATAIDNPNNQTADLENNWWGCNAGPGNAGCGAVTGTGADYNPWLVLGIGASPNPITPGASATVTADMTRNSDNAAPTATEFVPPVGVSFGSTQGTVAPPTGTIASGQATSIFTSTSALDGTASATVDNQTVNTNIGVTPPSFSIDDVTLNEGDSGGTAFTFTVTKTGATAFDSEVSLSVSDGTAMQGSDHNGFSGSLTFLPGDVSKTVTVVVNADTVYENNETFFLNLFDQVNATVGDGQGLGTIVNDDALPALSIDDHTFTGADSLVVAGFTVTLTGATDLPVTVHYQSLNDTAIAGEDYTAVSGTLTFNPGETTKPIPVNILPDATQEPTEQFFVDLDTPVNASIADGRGVGTIPNDDDGPAFAVDNVSHNEGDSGTTSYTFTITKMGGTALSSTVSYNTVDTGAVSPDDYTAATGSVVFGPADTTKQVTIQVNGDIGYEPDEAFTLHLSGTDNGSISDSDGAGMIANDDVPAGVQFGSAAYMEDESQSAVITVTRTGDTTGTTTVSFATSSGNATAGASCSLGVDYIETSATVIFDPNDTTKIVNVPVCVDTYPETVQTVNLALSNPTAPAVLGTQNTAVLSINDTASQYRSADPLVISSNVPANPYPSILPVSGAPNTSGSVRVTLYDVSHSHPEDLDILLVSPTGQKFILMADAGGANALNPAVTLTFDDNAFQVMPDSGAITTRKYEPTTWVSPVTDFAAPAPAGPYSEPGSSVGGAVSLRNIFGAFNPNGNWSLYVRDNSSLPPLAPQGTGLIAGGWGLEFLAPTAATADISGRVLTADGRPIANVRIILSGGGLTESRSSYTSHLGYYFFEYLTAGQSYVLTVKSRRFDFANPTRLINLMDDLTGEDFVAEPQE